jgi:leader peptidase (prepilin peptidase)/N-methyltransferase
MPSHDVYFLVLKIFWVIFAFAIGACAGSLINVLVYRLPRGISVVTPSSRCPSCETKLTWRENIPVFGWLLLGGRCRFCKSKISPEYPIVEAFVGLLFAVFFVLWYLVPDHFVVLGIDWGSIRPAWARPDMLDSWPRQSWPMFFVLLMLLGSLVAMTIVDAKTFTIPLVLTWTPTIFAAFVHPAYAAVVQYTKGHLRGVVPGSGWEWSLLVPSTWGTLGAAVGGVIGLALGALLLRLGLIRRSFADYEDWEAKVRAADPAKAPPVAPTDPAVGTPEMWIMYPHARREMIKELLFLSPCFMLAWLGGCIFDRFSGAPGLALRVLGGVLMGYLIGGGIVWGVRILGSLAFGKEAMGLGDAYLMAAVGACVGWIDAVLAFFGAAFVGLAWALLGLMLGGKVKKHLPYGPYLAVSTVLVLLCRPLIARLLAMLFPQ